MNEPKQVVLTKKNRKKLRKAIGDGTLREFAKSHKIGYLSVLRLLNAIRPVSAETVRVIANAAGLDVSIETMSETVVIFSRKSS